jgi:hypothetical protein
VTESEETGHVMRPDESAAANPPTSDTDAAHDAAPATARALGQREPITGRVARILNSRELVINRGAEHGVTVGMRFEVLAPQAEDIRDPDTGELLGSVDRPKVEVRVVQVEPKLAVARTFRARRKNIGGISMNPVVSRLFEPPQYVTQYDTLKTSERTWEDLDEKESFVKTGDPVREVLTDEDDG